MGSEVKHDEEKIDLLCADFPLEPSDPNNLQANIGKEVDKKSRNAKKKGKKVKFKQQQPLLHLDSIEGIVQYVTNAEDTYQAALELINLLQQNVTGDQAAIVIQEILPIFQTKVPDLSAIPLEQRIATVESYIVNQAITFETYNLLFRITEFDEKDLVGEFLLQQVKETSQGYMAEKILKTFHQCCVTNQDQLVNALLITFFRFEGSSYTLNEHLNDCDSNVKFAFLQKLDTFLVNNNEMNNFVNEHEILCIKNSFDIKKFLNRLFKAAPEVQHEYYEYTPNFLELCNWYTFMPFLFKLKYLEYTPYQGENCPPQPEYTSVISDEAWLELSQLLVLSSPGIKDRLCDKLREVHPEEERYWLERFNNIHEYDSQMPIVNSFIHTASIPNYHQPHKNFCYYTGRINHKLEIKFVDNAKDFESMLEYLQNQPVIGLDSEWLPIFSYKPTRVSILQISTIDICFILDLLHFHHKSQEYQENWRRFVSEVMANSSITKIGFGISQDLDNLKSSTGVPCSLVNSIDFAKYMKNLMWYLANQKTTQFGRQPQHGLQQIFINMIHRCHEPAHPQQGLSLMTYICFGRELDKSEQISNWNRRPLRQAQMLYAALDAFCLVDMHELLTDLSRDILGFHTFQDFLYAIMPSGGGASSAPVQNNAGRGRNHKNPKRNKNRGKNKSTDEYHFNYNPCE